MCVVVVIAMASPAERRDFVNEIEMMKKVAQGSNPHVVGLIGCVTREEPLCLIIEYLKYGDLQAYLHSIKEEVYILNMNASTYIVHVFYVVNSHLFSWE